MYLEIYIKESGGNRPIYTDGGSYTGFYVQHENGVDCIYTESGAYTDYYIQNGRVIYDPEDVPTDCTLEGGKFYNTENIIPWS
jgi:hypothetical protein